jgi:hypothetical protein
VLFAQRAVLGLANLGFKEVHVGVLDLGNRRQEEQNDEQGHKASDTKVCALHVLETLVVVNGVGEEQAGC